MRVGSRSFFFASRLLPRVLRDAVSVFYAFCRVADDLVDDGESAARGASQVRAMVERVFTGSPAQDAVERALADVAQTHALPRAPFDALVEGFEWDRDGRRYSTFDDLLAYCVRVAASVGVVMAHLMGRDDTQTLRRAIDLGVAMQLTNIARDVAEDGARGRVYLPAGWLAEIDLAPTTLESPRMSPIMVAPMVIRLLDSAEPYFASGLRGVGRLPWRYRWAIRSAASIYRDIGRVLRADPNAGLRRRAVTSPLRKFALSFRAIWPVSLGHPLPPRVNARVLLSPRRPEPLTALEDPQCL
jgi:phytoene synthase